MKKRKTPNHTLQRNAGTAPFADEALQPRGRSRTFGQRNSVKYKSLILLAAYFIAGCANPVNMYTADRYYNLGIAAETRGDLEQACMFLSRSYGNTIIGNAPPLARAHALYEYSRVSGYLGRIAEAEKGYKEVIALLDNVSDDPTHLRAPTHSEHAELLFANRRYRDSIPEFEKAVTSLDELSVESRYPGDYSTFLDKYITALRAVQNTDQANVIAKRVTKIRMEHPNAPVSPVQHKYVLADDIPAPSLLVTPLTHSTGK
jgi:tetratricopeptide (TPR) repeat protein